MISLADGLAQTIEDIYHLTDELVYDASTQERLDEVMAFQDDLISRVEEHWFHNVKTTPDYDYWSRYSYG